MYSFLINRTVNVPADKLFTLITDFTRSPSPTIPIEVETVGEKEHGIGTTRYITIGFFKVKERLESINPPDGFNYKLLSGAPIRNYLGTVKILPKESRSEIQWKVRFDPKIPYTGWLCGVICKSTINRLIDEIVENFQ